MRASHAAAKDHYVERLSESMARSNEHFGKLPKRQRRARLVLEERIWAIQIVLVPRQTSRLLAAVGPKGLLAACSMLQERVGEGGEERLEQAMAMMPSLDLFCHIMAERVSNRDRKVRAQDFHDVEHAVAGVYADFFVTSDRNLFDILTRRCRIPVDSGCQPVLGVEGLRAVLGQGC
jgi:hypothetical protein